MRPAGPTAAALAAALSGPSVPPLLSSLSPYPLLHPPVPSPLLSPARPPSRSPEARRPEPATSAGSRATAFAGLLPLPSPLPTRPSHRPTPQLMLSPLHSTTRLSRLAPLLQLAVPAVSLELPPGA
ncbi:unnamed protein product [Closterium sp. Naga37s-1]|nr:unnamed protein product [Closterium sp. Naga37s-1]